MDRKKIINGFSKLLKGDKIKWLAENFSTGNDQLYKTYSTYFHQDEQLQKLHDGFSENTITNFFMPYSIAPNFLIDGKVYAVPMVIEESSVVAAASSAAKFWMERGGFHTEIVDVIKVGHVSFKWNGTLDEIKKKQDAIKKYLIEETKLHTSNMESRGGGLKYMEFVSVPNLNSIFQLRAHFDTCNSMGANFINTILESYASSLEMFFAEDRELNSHGPLEIILSILSNYTPECLVKVWVECHVDQLNIASNPADNIRDLAYKFKSAVEIAQNDIYRATTHNKGIYNGIDAVVLATGNDFRAIEAAGHAYAARKGSYSSLSACTIDNDIFRFSLEVPLALGTVGGLTSLHPLAKNSLEILGNPDAKQLMSIIGSVGLAQNFAALKSLVTTGIQKGHMKMHLQNILIHLGATDHQKEKAITWFADKTVSHAAVREFLDKNE
ncbi:MAG: hypothetical protein RLZZ546_70 [Bacteroidota bacterium]